MYYKCEKGAQKGLLDKTKNFDTVQNRLGLDPTKIQAEIKRLQAVLYHIDSITKLEKSEKAPVEESSSPAITIESIFPPNSDQGQSIAVFGSREALDKPLDESLSNEIKEVAEKIAHSDIYTSILSGLKNKEINRINSHLKYFVEPNLNPPLLKSLFNSLQRCKANRLDLTETIQTYILIKANNPSTAGIQCLEALTKVYSENGGSLLNNALKSFYKITEEDPGDIFYSLVFQKLNDLIAHSYESFNFLDKFSLLAKAKPSLEIFKLILDSLTHSVKPAPSTGMIRIAEFLKGDGHKALIESLTQAVHSSADYTDELLNRASAFAATEPSRNLSNLLASVLNNTKGPFGEVPIDDVLAVLDAAFELAKVKPSDDLIVMLASSDSLNARSLHQAAKIAKSNVAPELIDYSSSLSSKYLLYESPLSTLGRLIESKPSKRLISALKSVNQFDTDNRLEPSIIFRLLGAKISPAFQNTIIETCKQCLMDKDDLIFDILKNLSVLAVLRPADDELRMLKTILEQEDNDKYELINEIQNIARHTLMLILLANPNQGRINQISELLRLPFDPSDLDHNDQKLIGKVLDIHHGFGAATYDARKSSDAPLMLKFAAQNSKNLKLLRCNDRHAFPGKGGMQFEGLDLKDYFDFENLSRSQKSQILESFHWANTEDFEALKNTKFTFSRGMIIVSNPGYAFKLNEESRGENISYSYVLFNDHYHNKSKRRALLVPTKILERKLRKTSLNFSDDFKGFPAEIKDLSTVNFTRQSLEKAANAVGGEIIDLASINNFSSGELNFNSSLYSNYEIKDLLTNYQKQLDLYRSLYADYKINMAYEGNDNPMMLQEAICWHEQGMGQKRSRDNYPILANAKPLEWQENASEEKLFMLDTHDFSLKVGNRNFGPIDRSNLLTAWQEYIDPIINNNNLALDLRFYHRQALGEK